MPCLESCLGLLYARALRCIARVVHVLLSSRDDANKRYALLVTAVADMALHVAAIAKLAMKSSHGRTSRRIANLLQIYVVSIQNRVSRFSFAL